MNQAAGDKATGLTITIFHATQSDGENQMQAAGLPKI